MTQKKSKPSAKVAARKRSGPKSKSRPAPKDGSRLIDERIRSLGDWRGKTLAEVRRIIREAAPDIIEECKWVKPGNPLGVPVWSHAGIVCTGETYREVVKLTFARGASLDDPHKLFNSSLEGNTRRAIDIRQGEVIDAKALKTLIQSAIAENRDRGGAKRKPSAKTRRSAKPVKLLSGGNPQITKGDGDAPVQAYIAAMPGWKRDIGKRLDALIVRSVRGVSKAMRWNTPFYGVDGQGFFVGFHCMTKYIKVAFFRGASLRPPPPVKSGQKNVRYFHIHEGEAVDEAQLSEWFKQAAELPGWKLGVS